MIWILYPIICSVLWGIGYTLLQPVSAKLTNYTINAIYGGSLCITNLIILAATYNFADFVILKDWKLALYLTFYVIIFIVASFVFLYGYGYDGINAGIYTLISSTYPVITMLLSFIFFNQTNINPYYASFGVVFTLVGVSLLALSKT
jgi:drug/metabolite transporter (DMT)-like permease